MAALRSKCGHYIFVLFLLSSFFFSSPNLSGRRLDVYHTSTHDVGLSVNLECRSEVFCMRLAGNTGRKNYVRNRHLCTIAQICRAMSSQLRHVSTIGKKLLNSNIASTCIHNMANFGPLMAEIGWQFGAPQQISTGFASSLRYCSDIAHRRPTVNQTLHDLWPSPGLVHDIYISGAFAPDGILPRAKFTLRSSLCVILYWHRYCTVVQQRGQPNFAAS